MSVNSLNQVYKNELERYTNQLIDEIKLFLVEEIPSGVNKATVEVFPDENGDGYISIGLYINSPTGAKHIAFAEYVNDLPLIDVQSYEEELSIPDLVVEHTKQWFAECWWKSCGWDYMIPVELYDHEGFGSGNLIKLTKNC